MSFKKYYHIWHIVLKPFHFHCNIPSDSDQFMSLYTYLTYGPCMSITATLYMYFPLHVYCSLHIDPTLFHISVENRSMGPVLIWPRVLASYKWAVIQNRSMK